MANTIGPSDVIHILYNSFGLDKNAVIEMFRLLNSNDSLHSKDIKDIFKILINYTYKLKKTEIALNEKYEKNFEEINDALKELKEEMKKIIKEPSSPPAPEPSSS
jgi:hypothetical protein